MKRWILISVVLFACEQAHAAGQIVAERDSYSAYISYVYMPITATDYVRFRILPAQAIGAAAETTYFCICGATRGKVYAGSRVKYDGYAATSGSWSAGGPVNTISYADTTSYGAYRDYTCLSGATHARVWARSVAGRDSIIVDFRDNSSSLATQTINTNGFNGIVPSTWLTVPAGTTKVRLSKATNDTADIQPAGIDFINISSQVTPDTAGSFMFDGPGGNTQTVMTNDSYSTLTGAASPDSTELAMYWGDSSSTYSAGRAIGSVGHRGIKFDDGTYATTTWQTQTGSSALITWSPSAGTKTVCDYLILTQTGGDGYAGSDYSGGVLAEADGTHGVNSKLIFSNSGVIVNNTVIPSVDIHLFHRFVVQCPVPSDVKNVYFEGETSSHKNVTASLASPIKTTQATLFGGTNKCIYTVSMIDVDSIYNYFMDVTTSYYPRFVVASEINKLYFNSYTTVENTAKDIAAGTVLSAKFKISIQDKDSLGAVQPAGGSSPFSRTRRSIGN